MEAFENWNAEDELDFRFFDLAHDNFPQDHASLISDNTNSNSTSNANVSSNSNTNANTNTNTNTNANTNTNTNANANANANTNSHGAKNENDSAHTAPTVDPNCSANPQADPFSSSKHRLAHDGLGPSNFDLAHKNKKRDTASKALSEKFSNVQRPSISRANSDLLLSSTNKANPRQGKKTKGQYPRSSFYIGASSIYDSALVDHMRLNGIDQVQLTADISLRKVDSRSKFLLREDYTDQLCNQSARDLDDIENIVKPYGPILVYMYFKFVHPFYPILHKKVFLEKYDRGYRLVSAPLLSSVYLLAMELWENEAKLIGRPKPDVSALYDIAKKTFFDVLERPKLTAVQAGLLLLQCNRYIPSSDNGSHRKWILCSQVVSLVEELGLGVDCGTWKLPKWEKGLRRRLAWAAFFQDKWISLTESRPSHLIPGVNWLVNDLTMDDFLESNAINLHTRANSTSNVDINRPSPTSSMHSVSYANVNSNNNNGNNSNTADDGSDLGKLFFIELIKLSKILSEILNSFYSLSASRNPNGIEQVLDSAKPLQLKLRSWHSSLPLQLANTSGYLPVSDPNNKLSPSPVDSSVHKLSSSSHHHRSPNSNAYLKLAYFIAEITLHRKIITTLTYTEPKELIDVCRTAAKTRIIAAIHFITQLKSEHIHSFWYAPASSDFALIGTFAMILFVTSVDAGERSFYKDQIVNYRWCLKIIAKNFYHAWKALRQFDTIYLQIPELVNGDGAASSNSMNNNGNFMNQRHHSQPLFQPLSQHPHGPPRMPNPQHVSMNMNFPPGPPGPSQTGLAGPPPGMAPPINGPFGGSFPFGLGPPPPSWPVGPIPPPNFQGGPGPHDSHAIHSSLTSTNVRFPHNVQGQPGIMNSFNSPVGMSPGTPFSQGPHAGGGSTPGLSPEMAYSNPQNSNQNGNGNGVGNSVNSNNKMGATLKGAANVNANKKSNTEGNADKKNNTGNNASNNDKKGSSNEKQGDSSKKKRGDGDN